jgi:hypothetical protein
MHRQIHRLSFDKKRTSLKTARSIVSCISCRGNMFTEPLPSNDSRDRHTDGWEGFMKYAIEMGLGP